MISKEKSRERARCLLIVIVLLICLILCACGEAQKSCSEELFSLIADFSLPLGVTYAHGAEEGGPGYLSPETSRALYGEGAEELLALCEDFAIFISERPTPFEAAVFRCYSASDSQRIVAMLLSRVEDIRIALRDTGLAGAYDSAEIEIRGRVVSMRVGIQNIKR